MKTKTCPKCGVLKSHGEFVRNKARHDGLGTYCRQCHNENSRQRRQTDADKAWRREWRRRPEQVEKRREYERDYTKRAKRREYRNKLRVKYYRANKAKETARAIVYSQIRRGAWVRPTSCEACGSKPEKEADWRSGIHAHHNDYKKPYEVTWLCRPCHDLHHTRAAREERR